MSAPTVHHHQVLEALVSEARLHQLAARIAWARSPNADTIRAEQQATEALNEALDNLADAMRQPRGMPTPRPMSS